MLVNVNDLVQLIAIAVQFGLTLNAAIVKTIAMHPDCYTKIGDVKYDIDDSIIDLLTTRCQKHGAIARAAAPALIKAIRADKGRIKVVARVLKATLALETANAVLRKRDDVTMQKLGDYDLDSVVHWAVVADDIMPNEHATIEHANARRTTPSENVQNKTLGDGSGHRKSLWALGTWIVTGGMFKSYACVVTDDSLTVTKGDDIVYSHAISSLAMISAKNSDGDLSISRASYIAMYRKENNGETPGKRNVPGSVWKMPKVWVEN